MNFITLSLILAIPMSALLLNGADEKDRYATQRACCAPDSEDNQSATISAAIKTSVPAEVATKFFDRFKALQGTWIGTSTKGWKEETTIRTIAQGSVVQFTSFDAHPNETMLTLVHMDSDRLLITHYCVAKNQPRLQLTSLEDEGKTGIFTFLDGTNLPSREKGHMDKVVYRFRDEDRFTSQWTWYQNGQERWMEEIVNERKR